MGKSIYAMEGGRSKHLCAYDEEEGQTFPILVRRTTRFFYKKPSSSFLIFGHLLVLKVF